MAPGGWLDTGSMQKKWPDGSVSRGAQLAHSR